MRSSQPAAATEEDDAREELTDEREAGAEDIITLDDELELCAGRELIDGVELLTELELFTELKLLTELDKALLDKTLLDDSATEELSNSEWLEELELGPPTHADRIKARAES